jgi:RNA polymerase sigma-70 factor (ECF subfamily)
MAMSDKELVRRCQTDEAAFEELLRRHRRAIYAYARAYINSREDAEEVTQDVFVKVYRAAHRFNSHYSFSTWLYTIASNTCKNKLRSRRRHQDNVSLDAGDGLPLPAPDEAGPLEVYRRNLEIAAVRRAIQLLPDGYREVLFLRYVKGLSYKDIADALGLSLGNVEARIFRGKAKVRERLARPSSEIEQVGAARPGAES